MIREAERGIGLYRIAKYRREILGITAEYEFMCIGDGEYVISVTRGGKVGRAFVKGDFFCAAELFKDIVINDTLPENMEDIEQDFTER